jgi:hypothetical protein
VSHEKVVCLNNGAWPDIKRLSACGTSGNGYRGSRFHCRSGSNRRNFCRANTPISAHFNADPSNTPVMVTATQTVTQTATTVPTTPVETQNPILLTLTATLGTGTPATNAPGTLQPSATSTVNANPAFSATVTETPHLQYYGTMPPYLAYSKITLNNKSKSEVYISLQCTTSEGYKTIIEYPVNGQIKANAPVGKYVYVAWVGGRKIIGKFTLSNDHDLIINIFKDHLEIK